MIRKRASILLIFSVLGTLVWKTTQAQDPEFTQFYANPLYLNPAFAGTARCPRLILNYRNQWPAISGTFVTYAASYDQHVDAFNGGVGVQIIRDDAGEGTINTTTASAMYAYQLNVNRNFSMKVGFKATFMQKALDWAKLNFGDMIDPRYGFIYQTNEIQGSSSVIKPDFSAGILGYSKMFFFGFAASHLTKPPESFTELPEVRLPRKYTGHVGAVIPLRRDPKQGTISPNILFQQQQDFMQLNMGLYVTKGPMVGGLWYRNQDSFILLVGVQSDVVKFGYSYDITVSKLSNATAGSHELSFAIQFDCRPKRRKFRTISCPSF
ncbi:MAG: type IX secretion system membrane protein PorP/SprF [Flavobacteriales bacterium]